MAIAALGVTLLASADLDQRLDPAAERWVASTLAGMTLDQKIGQMVVPSFEAVYTSSDSVSYDRLVRLVHEQHVGGFHVFGAREPLPRVLLGAGHGSGILGQPLAAASLINRLQSISPVPLINSADFETGVGFRLAGSTVFPRSMAFGAAGDERLAFEAGRITGVEARALGVHVNFAPVVDVNNNPRNPVINTRAFGEDPTLVGALGSAYVRGLHAGGMLATLKHFPGHGDTDVDSHLGLPLIRHPRERLDTVELPPFRAGLAAMADAVMVAHIDLPGLNGAEGIPATFSAPIVTGLLRDELRFDGLIYTDSMKMQAITEMAQPGEAAARAVAAGVDVVLHSPDDAAAVTGIRQAIERGEIDRAGVDASVERILRAKARLGLHRTKAVSLESIPTIVGTRAHKAVAREVSERAVTLVKDERGHVPLPVTRDAPILYLSVLDYPAGWRVAAPSRTFIPELRLRWPDVTAIELSDRTTVDELALVRAMAHRFAGIVVSVFVRASASSGRIDLAPSIAALLQDFADMTGRRGIPYVTVFFGNPYTAAELTQLPAMLLTYDFYDLAEASAVRALAGETAIGGRLPVALPEMFPAGHGLERPQRE